jgi:thiamine-phosphate pyrophosphorylase
MKLRKSLLKKSLTYPARRADWRSAAASRVYLILDKATLKGRSLKDIDSIIPSRYIGLVQLRDKQSAKSEVLDLAIKLVKKLRRSKTLFIVNDYIDVAVASGADGVHLGQSDLSLKQAREILGRDKIIGISCHNLRQALKAQAAGADYLGIGPVYATETKPDYKAIGLRAAAELKSKIKIPYFAIGNIHEGNIQEISSAGISRIAVCRAILKAKNPQEAAKRLYARLKIS